jgi:hypothetical protein
MKIVNMLILILIFIFSGCIPSLDSYAKKSIGRPISAKIDVISRPNSYASSIGWREKTYKLDNGNWVYVEPDSPNCLIHWEVNPQGIIVGYKLEGNRCY